MGGSERLPIVDPALAALQRTGCLDSGEDSNSPSNAVNVSVTLTSNVRSQPSANESVAATGSAHFSKLPSPASAATSATSQGAHQHQRASRSCFSYVANAFVVASRAANAPGAGGAGTGTTAPLPTLSATLPTPAAATPAGGGRRTMHMEEVLVLGEDGGEDHADAGGLLHLQDLRHVGGGGSNGEPRGPPETMSTRLTSLSSMTDDGVSAMMAALGGAALGAAPLQA